MFKLLLPILFPSWRFFDRMGPVIKIEVEQNGWREVKREPEKVPWIFRLFLNPQHNEFLFLITLAERIVFENNRACVEILRERLKAKFRILVDGQVQFES